jgi:exopolysaccharide biosynthesis predicted pyruvyltransferase EpsI
VAFDWLVEGLDRRSPVTFVPNPGNVGDALINLGCLSYLSSRFTDVRICSIDDGPQTENVLIGGGGNLVEPLYNNVAEFLVRTDRAHRLFLFPVTVQGNASLLKSLAPRMRCLCREPTSLAHVQTLLGWQNVRLAHDAAFLLGPSLRKDFAGAIARPARLKCLSFRSDGECAVPRLSGLDIMGQYQGAWTNVTLARNAVQAAARYLLGYRAVETDRLHCAILASILGRETVLFANSYFKNAAVFEHSLSRLSNARFTWTEENDRPPR